MSEKQEKPSTPDEFDEMAGGEPSAGGPADHEIDKSAIASEHASKLVSRLQDQIREERFLFLLAGLILLDAHILGSMENWAAPVVIGILQIFALLILARRCGVEEVQIWLDKVLSAIKR